MQELKFLVVEDHDFQRRLLMKLLVNLGAQAVHGAHDGASALQVVRDPDRPLDIVITDLSMPGMDGVEFIRHLSGAGPHLSLILSSALSPPLLASVAGMARGYGVDLLGVLAKPPSAVQIAPLIELHLARSRDGAQPAQAPPVTFGHDEIADAWERGAFECLLQPRVHLRANALVAAQATMYWRHPTRGLLAPELFMPTLRERGFGDDAAWLMLRKAAGHRAALRLRGLDLKVSVNLGLASLAESDLAPRLLRTVEHEAVEPRHLILSIIESSIDTNATLSMENLLRLRVAGFELAIADFGSGWMSREQLGRVAFNELVIQKAFVAPAARDESARVGLASGLQVARELHLPTVADGIEDQAGLDLMREWGCDAGQGEFICGPRPFDAFVEWALAWELQHPRPMGQRQ